MVNSKYHFSFCISVVSNREASRDHPIYRLIFCLCALFVLAGWFSPVVFPISTVDAIIFPVYGICAWHITVYVAEHSAGIMSCIWKSLICLFCVLWHSSDMYVWKIYLGKCWCWYLFSSVGRIERPKKAYTTYTHTHAHINNMLGVRFWPVQICCYSVAHSHTHIGCKIK